MGQQLFYPPNVAGWKNNAYWVNSTALWARADFARQLTWRAHDDAGGYLHEIAERDVHNVHVLDKYAAIDLAYERFGLSIADGSGSQYVHDVLVTWLDAQRVAEGPPTWAWRHYAPLSLTTMMMLTPDFQLA